MTELLGVSRKTGYKIKARYEEVGPERPVSCSLRASQPNTSRHRGCDSHG